MDHSPPGSSVHEEQEHWSGLSCLPPGDLPDPGVEPMSLMSPAMAGGSLPLVTSGKPILQCILATLMA